MSLSRVSGIPGQDHQHRTHAVAGFTARYRITRLVYIEETTDITAAITREKQIKGWRRNRKIELIEKDNPTWDDLAADWFEAKGIADSSLRSE